MEPHEQIQQHHSWHEQRKGSSSQTFAVKAVIGLMLTIAGYFCYALISGRSESADTRKAAAARQLIIQLDVLNGCGVKGMGAKFTNYLRTHGFDVVEMKNYKTFSVSNTLVIDRVGNLSAARHVASALGVAESHVIQQINPDYFVDVSVIIGADYSSLRSAN